MVVYRWTGRIYRGCISVVAYRGWYIGRILGNEEVFIVGMRRCSFWGCGGVHCGNEAVLICASGECSCGIEARLNE